MRRVPITGIALVLVGLVAAGGLAANLRRSAGRAALALAKARQLHTTGNPSAAARAYDEYLMPAGKKADPDVLLDHAVLALDIASAGDASPNAVGMVFSVANMAILQRPRDMRLRRRLPELQLSQGLYAEAREHLLAIRDGGGRLADSQQKRLREAWALLRDAGDARKRWQATAALSADIESMAGNHGAAFSHLEKPVAWGPRDPGLIREFVTAAERALSIIDPASADSTMLVWMGGLCLRAGLSDRAAHLFTQATRIDPSPTEEWIRLAECRMSENAKEAAAAAIAAGVEAVSEYERRLVDFLIQRKRGGDAMTFLQEVVDGRWGDRAELKSWSRPRLAGLRDRA